MSELYFLCNTVKTTEVTKIIGKYVPLSLKISYNYESAEYTTIQFMSGNQLLEIQFGTDFGELYDLSLVQNFKFNFVNDKLDVDQYPNKQSSIALWYRGLSTNKEINIIKKPCLVDVFFDACKITLPDASSPCLLIRDKSIGVLTDLDLKICSFIVWGITFDDHTCLVNYEKHKNMDVL